MRRNKGYIQEWFSWKCMAIGQRMEFLQRSKASSRKWAGKNTAETTDILGQTLTSSSVSDPRSQTFTSSSRTPAFRTPLQLSIKHPRVQLQLQSSSVLRDSRRSDKAKRGSRPSVASTISPMLGISAWRISSIEFWRSREHSTGTPTISRHWPSFCPMITQNSLMFLQKGSWVARGPQAWLYRIKMTIMPSKTISSPKALFMSRHWWAALAHEPRTSSHQGRVKKIDSVRNHLITRWETSRNCGFASLWICPEAEISSSSMTWASCTTFSSSALYSVTLQIHFWSGDISGTYVYMCWWHLFSHLPFMYTRKAWSDFPLINLA